jgi:hypothetical protein
MPDWFGKKKSVPETSPGGSVIHRYAKAAWSSRRTVPVQNAEELAEARHQVYKQRFGEPRHIYKDALPGFPSVDVHTYFRRNVCTLVTSGMSDLPMNIPAGADVPRRVELIFYCSEPRPEYCDVLQWLAHFPHDQKSWIGWGHTVPNGTPPAPFWGSTILDTVLFMEPIVKVDQTLAEALTLGGDPVRFLWVIPLTTPECNFKLEKGTSAILGLFQQNRHPYVFDPTRKSYV